jgi:hypothetical protein
MSTRNDKLILSIAESKTPARRYFAFLAVLTAMGTALTLALLNEPNLAPFFLGFFVLLPGVFMVMAGIRAFKPARHLTIYEDRFVLTKAQDNSVIDEARWLDVDDVTIIVRQQASSAQLIGGALFGVLGSMIGSAMSSGNEFHDTALVIYRGKQRLRLDNAFGDVSHLRMVITRAAREVWVSEALRQMNTGGSAQFGNIQVNARGITQGKHDVEWQSIEDAQYTDAYGRVAVTWNDGTRKNSQSLSTRMGSRGDALIELVRQKLGKPQSFAQKLGKL